MKNLLSIWFLLVAGANFLFVCLLLITFQTNLNAQVGPNYCGTAVNAVGIGTIVWSSEANAQGVTDDDIYAVTGTLGTNEISNYLKCTNFAFAIPNGNTIVGVEVIVNGSKTGTGTVRDEYVYLVVGGTIQTGTNRATNTALGTTDANSTYGTSTDLWGLGLSESDVEAVDFGVAFSFKKVGGGGTGTHTARIDRVSITVYHTPPVNKSSTGGGGNWSDGTKWSPAGAPAQFDNVTITSGNNITIDADETCGNLTIDNGATLTHGTNNELKVYGNYSNSGSETGGNASSELFLMTSASTFGTDGTNTGAITIGGEVYFNANYSVSASANINVGVDVVINGASVSVTNNGIINMNIGAKGLSGTGSWTNASGSTLKCAGSITVSSFTASASTNTVEFQQAANQSVNGINYSNLTLSGGNTKTSSGNITVAGVFTINSGTTMDPDAYNLAANGNCNINGTLADGNTGGTVNLGDAAGDNIDLYGGTIHHATVTEDIAINGTIVFSIAGTATVGRCNLTVAEAVTVPTGCTMLLNNNTGIKTFNKLVTINTGGGTWTSTTVSTTGNLIFQNGITHNNGANFTAGGATFNTNAQTIGGSGSLSFANGVTFTGGDVNLNVSGGITFSGTPITVTTILATNNTAVTMSSTTAGTLTGTGTWAQAANSTLNYAGSSITTIALNASGNPNTVEYNRSGGVQTIYAPSTSYHHLIVSNAGAATTKTLQAGVTIDVNGDLTISGNTSFAASTSNITLAGNWTNNSSHVTPFDVSGAGSQYVKFDGAAAQQITGSALTAFEDITVDKGTDISAPNTVEAIAAGSGMSMSGQLTLTNGMLKLTDVSASAQFNASVTTAQSSGLWVNGGSFTGNGNFSVTFNGLLRITSGSATFGTSSGNALEINNQGLGASYAILDIQNGVALSVAGRLFINNAGSMTMTDGTVTVCTVGLANASNAAFEVSATSSVNISGGTVVFQRANSNSAGGDVILSSGTGTKTFTGGTFQFGNVSTPTATTFYLDGNSLGVPSVTVSNLCGGGCATKPTVRLKSNLVVNGNMVIQSSTTVDASKDGGTNNYDITVTGNAISVGDWSNSGTFNARDKTVTFNNSTTAQSIGGTASTTFNNLTITNGSATGVTLNVNTTTSSTGVLTLSDGELILNDKTLTVSNNATGAITGGSATTYIKSESEISVLKWDVGTSTGMHEFPFGKDGVYIPFKLDVTTGSPDAGSYSASSWYTLANATWPTGASLCADAALTEDDITDRFWLITLAGYTTNPVSTTRFYYNPAELEGIAEADLYLSRWNSGDANPCKWEPYDSDHPQWTVGFYATTNELDNYIEITNMSQFSPWSMVRKAKPLPISLLSFDVEMKNGNVDVNWVTATETNNDFFTIEKTKDSEKYAEVAKVKGAGNSSEIREYRLKDENPFKGISYYRLKQTDFDGKTTYSKMIAVNNPEGKDVVFTVFPNPSNGMNVNISLAGYAGKEEVIVVLNNIKGEQVFSKVVITDDNGSFITAIDPEKKLAAGVYFVVGSSRTDIFSRKLIIR